MPLFSVYGHIRYKLEQSHTNTWCQSISHSQTSLHLTILHTHHTTKPYDNLRNNVTMLATRAPRLVCARQIGQAAKAAAHSPAPAILTYRPLLGAAQNLTNHSQTRQFSSIVKDKVPKKDPPSTRITQPIFPGPTYTDAELLGVEVGHREPECLSDRLAWRLVRGARGMVDTITGVTDTKPLSRTQYVRQTV